MTKIIYKIILFHFLISTLIFVSCEEDKNSGPKDSILDTFESDFLNEQDNDISMSEDIFIEDQNEKFDDFIPDSDFLEESYEKIDDIMPDDELSASEDIESAEDSEDINKKDEFIEDEYIEEISLTIEDFKNIISSKNKEAFEDFFKIYTGPFCDEIECLIITQQKTGTSVQILGDFNSWQDGTYMDELEFDQGYFYFFLNYDFINYTEYKLKLDGEWSVDHSNIYIRFGSFGINSAIYKNGVSRLCTIRDIYSEELNNTRDIYMYLPAVYFTDKDSYLPVVYMQDGINSFDNPAAPFGSWDTNITSDQLIKDSLIKPLIIVGIDTHDRLNEYLYTDIILDDGATQVVPKLDDYAKLLVNKIIPIVNKNFRTLHEPENTAIAGSSLGGISALYIAWKNTDVFGKAASLSGSFWVGESGSGTEDNPSIREIMEMDKGKVTPADLKVYLDSGDSGYDLYPYIADGRVYTDWVRNAFIKYGWDNRLEWDDDNNLDTAPKDFSLTSDPEQVPTLYWSETVPSKYIDWNDYLKPENNLLHLVGEGHSHNESAWKLRFKSTLIFLFSTEK